MNLVLVDQEFAMELAKPLKPQRESLEAFPLGSWEACPSKALFETLDLCPAKSWSPHPGKIWIHVF